MMTTNRRPTLGLVIAAAVIIAVIIAIWPRTPAEQPNTPATAPLVAEKKAPEPSPSGDSVLPPGKERPASPPPDAGVAERAKVEAPPPPVDADSPLLGLEGEALDLNQKEKFGLPEKLKGGFVIKSVDPAAPAAEAHLEPNDVITRAHHSDITSLEDLQRAIGDREQTMLRVYRNGKPFDVVLHKPWRGK